MTQTSIKYQSEPFNQDSSICTPLTPTETLLGQQKDFLEDLSDFLSSLGSEPTATPSSLTASFSTLINTFLTSQIVPTTLLTTIQLKLHSLYHVSPSEVRPAFQHLDHFFKTFYTKLKSKMAVSKASMTPASFGTPFSKSFASRTFQGIEFLPPPDSLDSSEIEEPLPQRIPSELEFICAANSELLNVLLRDLCMTYYAVADGKWSQKMVEEMSAFYYEIFTGYFDFARALYELAARPGPSPNENAGNKEIIIQIFKEFYREVFHPSLLASEFVHVNKRILFFLESRIRVFLFASFLPVSPSLRKSAYKSLKPLLKKKKLKSAPFELVPKKEALGFLELLERLYEEKGAWERAVRVYAVRFARFHEIILEINELEGEGDRKDNNRNNSEIENLLGEKGEKAVDFDFLKGLAIKRKSLSSEKGLRQKARLDKISEVKREYAKLKKGFGLCFLSKNLSGTVQDPLMGKVVSRNEDLFREYSKCFEIVSEYLSFFECEENGCFEDIKSENEFLIVLCKFLSNEFGVLENPRFGIEKGAECEGLNNLEYLKKIFSLNKDSFISSVLNDLLSDEALTKQKNSGPATEKDFFRFSIAYSLNGSILTSLIKYLNYYAHKVVESALEKDSSSLKNAFVQESGEPHTEPFSNLKDSVLEAFKKSEKKVETSIALPFSILTNIFNSINFTHFDFEFSSLSTIFSNFDILDYFNLIQFNFPLLNFKIDTSANIFVLKLFLHEHEKKLESLNKTEEVSKPIDMLDLISKEEERVESLFSKALLNLFIEQRKFFSSLAFEFVEDTHVSNNTIRVFSRWLYFENISDFFKLCLNSLFKLSKNNTLALPSSQNHSVEKSSSFDNLSPFAKKGLEQIRMQGEAKEDVMEKERKATMNKIIRMGSLALMFKYLKIRSARIEKRLVQKSKEKLMGNKEAKKEEPIGGLSLLSRFKERKSIKAENSFSLLFNKTRNVDSAKEGSEAKEEKVENKNGPVKSMMGLFSALRRNKNNKKE